MSHCLLKCVQNSHKDIVLKNGEVVVIGRGPLTRIKNTKCSRRQVEVIADVGEKKLQIKQLGPNPSSVNGIKLKENEIITIEDEDEFCFLHNQFAHVVKFDSNNPGKSTNDTMVSKSTRKRLLEDINVVEHSQSKMSKIADENYVSEENDELEEERVAQISKHLSYIRNHSLPPVKDINPIAIHRGKMENTTPYWSEPDNFLLMFTAKGVKNSDKIAAFDLDGTIITTKSGRVFPINSTDYRILYPEVLKKLQILYENGFKLVIFTNQKSLHKKTDAERDFKRKIENILIKLRVPVQVFIALGDGIYRKPAIGMWTHLVKNANGNIPIDMTSSFYVGDAAGRPARWSVGKKKDFSISDRLFAINIELEFFTPEEYFLNWNKAPFTMPVFDPRVLRSAVPQWNESLTSKKQELIILVGYPASGKSHFAKEYLASNGYVIVNRDTLGEWQKCVSMCKNALNQQKSVVIDNTNPDVESRKRYIDCIHERNIACRCFLFDISLEHARHNNKFRQLTSAKASDLKVNDMVLNQYKSKFQTPTLSEGFSSIVKINFTPRFYKTEYENLYFMFLV